MITYKTTIKTESIEVCGNCINKSVQDETYGLLYIYQESIEKILCNRCGTDITATAGCVRCGTTFEVKTEKYAVPEAAS